MIEYNYKMFIAGKERIIPQVELSPSKSGSGQLIVQNTEFIRISKSILSEIFNGNEIITLEELQMSKDIYEFEHSEFLTIFNLLSDEEWISWKKDVINRTFTEDEDAKIKTFLKRVEKNARD